jgi:hypothetical protein
MTTESHKTKYPKHPKDEPFCDEKIRPPKNISTKPVDRLRNLCTTCIHDFPTCPANFSDVKYGEGINFITIINCTKFEEDLLWI